MAYDGLPLSLKVFGVVLCGENDKCYWEDHLDKLKISYEKRERYGQSRKVSKLDQEKL